MAFAGQLRMINFDGVIIEPIGRSEPFCPYCGVELTRFPKRKMPCPHCTGLIFSKVQPFDGKKWLITADMVPLVERQWEAYQSLKRLLGSNADSPAMLAMYDSLMSGDRGRTVIDWNLVDRYYASDRDLSVPWSD